MANERLFIVRNAAGEEFEPADQQTLVKWAEMGKIDLDCKIRSTLVNKWDNVLDIPFLKPLLKEQVVARVNAQHNTPWERLKARINLKVEDISNSATNGLVKRNSATAPTASVPMRIMALLTDLLIMLIWGVILHLTGALCYKYDVIEASNLFYIGFSIYFPTFLFYFIFFMYLNQQTPGQRFWGIYLVKMNGESYWMGRIFFYVVFMFGLGILNPLFLFACGRTVQEVLTSTRMTRIVIDPNKIKNPV